MKRLKVIGLAIAATLVVSSATAVTAMAAGSQQSSHKHFYSENSSGAYGSNKPGASHMFKGILDKLVTAGTITSDQETAIQKAISDAAKSGGMKVDLNTILGNLVTAGTITADQQTAIENAVKPANPGHGGFDKNAMFKGALDKLVTAGTITSDQETAIQKAISDAVKSGSGKVDLNTVLGNLVTAGTITADQQTALENALKPSNPGHGGFGMSNRSHMYSNGASANFQGKHFSA